MPSNYREMCAVLMGLHSFLPLVKGKSVEVVSDNISTVAYLNHLGGPARDLSDMATAIWSFAFQHNMHITPRHLAGRNNTLADALSRLNPRYEWKLYTALFKWLDRKWGPHTIDRCATILNTQLPRYNSRFFDPRAEAVDALAQNNWQGENNFVNPPFRLIPQVIQTLKQQQSPPVGPLKFGIINCAIAEPIMLPKSSRTVWSVGPKAEPLKNVKWQLMAWRVCGAHTCKTRTGQYARVSNLY